jgi:predicted DNA-binding transcriptional regulator YafY
LQEQRKQYDAVVSLHPQAALSLRGWCITSPAEGGKKHPAREGWLTLNVRFEEEEQARFILLGFGPRVRVLEPAALRERIVADAAAILDG